jgi:hypothetical protein
MSIFPHEDNGGLLLFLMRSAIQSHDNLINSKSAIDSDKKTLRLGVASTDRGKYA